MKKRIAIWRLALGAGVVGSLSLAGLCFTSVRALGTTPGSLDGCLECTTDGCTVGGTHKVNDAVFIGNSEGSGHSYCSAIGSCLMGHQNHSWVGYCEVGGLQEADLALLETAVQRGDRQALGVLLDEHSKVVLVNRDRGTIQVVGCNGEISFQWPVQPDLLAALTAS